MSGPGCVVDAGVLAAWFISEDDGGPVGGENAQALLELASRGRLALHTPELAFAEASNVLWKYVRLRGYPAAAAEKAVAALARLPLHAAGHGPLLPEAFALALRYGITVYDALYVALAARDGLPLVTTDARLAQAVRPCLASVTMLAELF